MDLKLPGYEERVVDALRGYGLVERTLISTMDAREHPADPRWSRGCASGWSVPRLEGPDERRSPSSRRTSGVRVPRRELPRAARAHWSGGSLRRDHGPLAARHPALVRAIHEAAASSTCGPSTTGRGSSELERLGVTGVITNDPRLFGRTAPSLLDQALRGAKPAGSAPADERMAGLGAPPARRRTFVAVAPAEAHDAARADASRRG